MSTPTPEQLRSLLLHRLPEEQAQQVEEQLMQDAAVSDLLRHEETDLVDEYVLGQLVAEDRAAFEEHLLPDPAIRERIQVARSLHGVATVQGHTRGRDATATDTPLRAYDVAAAAPILKGRPVPARSRRPMLAVAAVVATCAVAVALLMYANHQADIAPSPPAPTAVAPPTTAEPPTDALDSGPEDLAESPASIVLLADVQRGGEAQVVRVKPGAAQIRLQAETTNSDSSLAYRLSIKDESGAALFSADELRPLESGGYVFVEATVPSSRLGTGRRVVTLEAQSPGIEPFTWQVDVQPEN